MNLIYITAITLLMGCILEPKPERNKPIIDEIEIDTPKHKE